MTAELYTDAEIERTRALQRLLYDCAEEVAADLKAGVTEREAASRLGELLIARGVDGFFHQPFAWFGDRSGLGDIPRASLLHPIRDLLFAREFFPSDRRLEPGMCAILDVAAIRDGLTADIGYSFSLGESDELADARRVLLELRELILDGVRAKTTMRELYRAVDDRLTECGYENAHAHYPSAVLGHKVGRIPFPSAASKMVVGFDYRAILYLGRQLAASLVGRGRAPLCNEGPLSQVPLEPGMWAFEPHIRRGAVGAKWEEIMVVTEDDAYWLDDDLPHTRTAAESRQGAPAAQLRS